MARPEPRNRATGGGVTKLFANGVEVGRAQNATISTTNLKVSVEEIGDMETIEHVMNGMRVTLNIGFVMLKNNSLESQNVVFPTDKLQIPDFNPVDLEFRTLRDEPIVKVTNCTPSSNQQNIAREGVWGRNVSWDGTWVFQAEDM